ncbi:MAG: FtsX-like permease family protein [Vicinamibacterales bacterium]|jgi:putative ABC transport system permease protein|nr:FtsX-like permease family protein [Vicinamibacterales bacterium]
MSQVLFGDTSGSRIVIGALGICAFLALVLAAVGIYGVLSYSATQRTREVGIRMALGAETGDVLRLILGQGMVPVAAGLVVGLAISLAVTRLIAGLLFRVSPTDPVTFGGVTLLLGGVGLLASLVPALRAGRLQPVTALRDD